MKFPMRVVKNVPLLRRYLDAVAKYSNHSFNDAVFASIQLGGTNVPALTINDPTPQVVLYIHGGGFVFGSSDAYKGFVSKVSARLGIQAIIPDYALAPEHPFPAGFNDVMNSYIALLEQGYAGKDIALMGDSAGGNLILAAMAEILKRAIEPPACVVALAAQTDFTFQGDSLTENRKSDCVLVSERYLELRQNYLGDTDPADPRASPLFGEFTNAPPVQIQVAKHEILYDDNIAMAAKLRADGADVELHQYDHGFHVFQLLAGKVPAADTALDTATNFIAAHLQR
jgi:acetyl esterase/lipase